MKIQPEANNAVVIELDDGSSLRMHSTIHGNTDYLFISGDILTVEVADGLNWKKVAATGRMIRVSSKPERR